MRRARIKVDGEGIYHVVSRIGGRRFLLDDKEKGILLGMIRRAAGFSGVEVYTYAIMDNHFHLLVRVPGKREVSEEELRRRVVALYGAERAGQLFAEWAKRERKGKNVAVEAEKERLKTRMNDLSQFCKMFKEAYTQDYNRRTGNTGTIWESRFKSLLIEGAERAILTVAGYIHLNPLRAGMAAKASEAGNTGYGAACMGDATARAGLEAMVALAQGKGAGEKVGWTRARDVCRNTLEGQLAWDESATGLAARPNKDTYDEKGTGRTEVGAPSHVGLLGHRRCEFVQGGALGSQEFLKKVAETLPPRIRRKPEGKLEGFAELGLASVTGVRKLKGLSP
jgi:REP element-mobilizing transposase RayT